MKIHGREYDFMLTVGASADIAEMCPDGDINRIGEVLNASYGKQARTVAKIIAALSRGYENAKKYEDEGYEPHPISVDEVLSLSPAELVELQTYAFEKFTADSKQTVEVENSKKNSETA